MVMGSNKNNSSRAVPPPLAGADKFLRREIDKKDFKKIMRNISSELKRLQEMTSFIDLPPSMAPVPNMQPQFRLQFINKVRNPSFTTNLVRDDNGSPIKVAIYDTSTKSIVSPDNFLSSAKVKTIVLNAEFVENKGETLSRVEFNQSVLRERERKGPILTGRSHIIQLQNGVGTFENIVFNDNSSWTKSGFRLGVTVVSDGEEGYFNGERVQEGVSETFRVKDRRMKASQKPDRLKLTHKVQSLKKIGKDRASLLQKKNINTVEDFLKIYYNDEPALREILCIKSESGKEWDSMVEHATQCADEFHAKYNALNNSSRPQQVLMEEEVDILNPVSNNINIPSIKSESSKEWESMVEHMMECAGEYHAKWNASNNSSSPRQTLVHPMEGNCGHSVAGSGSSESNPSENDRIEGSMLAIYRRYQMQRYLPFIPNDGIFPELELTNDLISMKNSYADAQSSSNYNTQVPSIGGFLPSANRKNYMHPPYPRFRGRITWEKHNQKHEFSVWS